MRLHSTKYDGSLHYRFPIEPVLQRDDLLVVYSPLGVTIDSYRFTGKISVERHLGLCWPDRHYNVWVKWREDWTPASFYVNIATPADWSDGTLRYIDLDLDLILRAGASEPILDDADEFAAHAERWRYPAELVETCLATAVEVAGLMRRQAPPFDGRLYAWRPGSPLPRFESHPAASR